MFPLAALFMPKGCKKQAGRVEVSGEQNIKKNNIKSFHFNRGTDDKTFYFEFEINFIVLNQKVSP